jgi:TonB family protein
MIAPLIACLLFQSPPPPSAPQKLGPGIKQPILVHKVEPSYSSDAKKAGLEGTVQLEAVIEVDGSAHDFKVKRPLGLGLDEQAIHAVSQWRFSPAEKGGTPVPVFVVVDVNFRLLDKKRSPWRVTRIDYDAPPGADKPSIAKLAYPQKAPDKRGTIALTFDIDEHGNPRNLSVDKSADSQPEQVLIEAVKKWRFKPAMKDGQAVAARATFEFKGSPFTPIGK